MKTKVFLALLASFFFSSSYAYYFIPEKLCDIGPPEIYVNGKRTTPIRDYLIAIDPFKGFEGRDDEANERCGSGRHYRHGRYYRSGRYAHYGDWNSVYEDEGVRGFIRHKWEHRLEGYWEADGWWHREYEIVVARDEVRIRKAGWYGWRTLYPVKLERTYGWFENRKGDFLEWDHGKLYWHRKGKRTIRLYRPGGETTRSCRR